MRTEAITSIHAAERGKALPRLNITESLRTLQEDHVLAEPRTADDTAWMLAPEVVPIGITRSEGAIRRLRFSVERLPQVQQGDECFVRLVPQTRQDRGVFVTRVTREDYATLGEVGIRQLDATVQIGKTHNENRTPVSSAVIIRVNGIQAVNDHRRKAELTDGQRVLVENTAVTLEAGGEDTRLVNVAPLNFTGGTLEVLDPPFTIPGDKVQVRVRYYKPTDGRPEKCVPTGPVYLLKPSAQRRELYASQRMIVEEGLSSIAEAEEPREKRRRAALLIKTYLFSSQGNKSEYDSVNLTAQERAELTSLMAALPPEERPALAIETMDNAAIREVEQVRNTYTDSDLYQMTQADLFAFCMGVAQGENRPQKDAVTYDSLSSIFFLVNKLPRLQREEVLTNIAFTEKTTDIPEEERSFDRALASKAMDELVPFLKREEIPAFLQRAEIALYRLFLGDVGTLQIRQRSDRASRFNKAKSHLRETLSFCHGDWEMALSHRAKLVYT